MTNHLISRRAVLAGTAAAGAFGLTGFPARAEVNWKKYAGTKLEVILAKGPRGDNSAEVHQGIHRAHRHQGRVGADPRAAAAPEGRDRARLGQAELRRGASQLSRAEAAVREGRLARRHDAGFMKDPNLTAPDLVESDFSAAGLQYAKNDKGQMLLAAVVGRLLHPLLQQGAVREEGRRGAEDARRDGRRRRKAHRRQGRHLRLCRARPAQRQHDAVDQLLPQLRRRIPRRQGQHPDRRAGGDRGDQVLRRC